MKPLSSRGRKGITFVLGMAVTAVVLLLVWAIVVAAVSSSETNERGERREGQVERNDETLAIVKDCTQPAGTCFKRSQRATARVVADLSRVIVLTAACGAEVSLDLTTDQRIDQITGCVTERLSRPHR